MSVSSFDGFWLYFLVFRWFSIDFDRFVFVFDWVFEVCGELLVILSGLLFVSIALADCDSCLYIMREVYSEALRMGCGHIWCLDGLMIGGLKGNIDRTEGQYGKALWIVIGRGVLDMVRGLSVIWWSFTTYEGEPISMIFGGIWGQNDAKWWKRLPRVIEEGSYGVWGVERGWLV